VLKLSAVSNYDFQIILKLFYSLYRQIKLAVMTLNGVLHILEILISHSRIMGH
jgi:hypothetical protein